MTIHLSCGHTEEDYDDCYAVYVIENNSMDLLQVCSECYEKLLHCHGVFDANDAEEAFKYYGEISDEKEI